jgi:hypothetical protein
VSGCSLNNLCCIVLSLINCRANPKYGDSIDIAAEPTDVISDVCFTVCGRLQACVSLLENCNSISHRVYRVTFCVSIGSGIGVVLGANVSGAAALRFFHMSRYSSEPSNLYILYHL